MRRCDNAARHTWRLKIDSLAHCQELPADIAGIYLHTPFCSQRSIFGQHFHVCRSAEYLRGCLWSETPGTIHLTGNEQCVNIYTKGLRDMRATICFHGGSSRTEGVC